MRPGHIAFLQTYSFVLQLSVPQLIDGLGHVVQLDPFWIKSLSVLSINVNQTSQVHFDTARDHLAQTLIWQHTSLIAVMLLP